MELAQRVWKTMKESDSRECRNCHSWDAMHLEKQNSRSRVAMAKGQKEGKTCIDCHKGIAHLLPKEFKGDDE
jgi:nitrate/TMAO reductase-like tetraheme cytochrome c subunit